MDNKTKRPLYIPLGGPALLGTPLLNKGLAFSKNERMYFNLEGLLPERIETIEEQEKRSYMQLKSFHDDMEKHIYLRNIQDTNETLFYRLVNNHIDEIMPLIYTPTVGAACEKFSEIYRRGRGIFLSYDNKDRIDDILNNASIRDVKVVVVTDGERILGLGDQGIGGMGIPIGKLSLYTACGGISPAYTLPIIIDVGTNNQTLIDDPLYMGWKHNRITGKEYDEFIDKFMQSIKRRWPDALIQFEDFALKNSNPILKKYKHDYRCFNDDIQGTASVALGSLLAACKSSNTKISEQRVVFVGSGSAGCGIAEAIVSHMVKEGLSQKEARSNVYMIDRFGLLTNKMPNLLDFQEKLAQDQSRVEKWGKGHDISLLDVVKHAKPTILIGVSGVSGLFTKEVIQSMYSNCKRPIIFPLSNPTSRVEATPSDIIEWTEGNALVATGSPFVPVLYKDKSYAIAQCNNSYIFPGVGLGVISVNASRVTDEMFLEASEALSDCSPLAANGHGSLLPSLQDIQEVSKYIAFKVAKKAIEQNLAPLNTDERIKEKIEENFWKPNYREYRRTSF